MTEAQVLQMIIDLIIANGNNEITANVLRPVLVAILEQPNNEIGNKSDLQTTNKDNLVSAINEILGLSGSEISILNGTTDPNVTPPAVVSMADFYVWNDGSLKGLFQYNGVSFVEIKDTDASDLISGDADNAAEIGTDGKIFVPDGDFIPTTEQTLTGSTQTILNGTGAITATYNTHSQLNLTLIADAVLTITLPNLEVGQSCSRLMHVIPNGFSITFDPSFTNKMAGFDNIDFDKEFWIVTRFTRESASVVSQFSNLTVFPFEGETILEENIVGTATVRTISTATFNIDINASVYQDITISANTVLTFTNIPVLGTSVARTYQIKSTGNQSLGISNSVISFGEYNVDGTINLVTVVLANTSTGVAIHVFFNQPN